MSPVTTIAAFGESRSGIADRVTGEAFSDFVTHVTVADMVTFTKMRGRGVLVAAAVTALIQGCFAGGHGDAHADPVPQPPYPVPYHFIIDAIGGALQGAQASPPGTNNWSCRPSARHPEPVVLVHGFLANRADNWQTYGPLLANEGYCVFALNYGNDDPNSVVPRFIGGLGSLESSALTLGAFVDQVRAATGAAKVDIVGHSEGATMPYWYLKFDHGADKVARFVGLAPFPHGGRGPAELLASACSGACSELSADSPFIRRLDAAGVTAPGVAYTQIMTRYDESGSYDSGIVHAPNSTNIIVQDQCPGDHADHLSLASDPVAAGDVLNALDPANAQPVQCVGTLPFIGVP